MQAGQSGTGIVAKKTEKGFGFITVDGEPQGSKDLFFHGNSLKNISFEELRDTQGTTPGDKVSFTIEDSEKGLNAVNVNKV